MKCTTCKSELSYSAEYDSYYCLLCDLWRETQCTDVTCMFCSIRPERPSLVTEDDSYLPDGNTPEVIEDQIKWMEEIVEKRNGDKK